MDDADTVAQPGYHRLGYAAPPRWWIPAAHALGGTVVFASAGLCVLFGALLAALVAGRPEGADGTPGFGAAGDSVIALAAIAAGLPTVFRVAHRWQHRPAGTVSSVAGRLRRAWLGRCLLVAVPVAVLAVAAATTADGVRSGRPWAAWDAMAAGWVGWSAFALPAAVLLVVVPVQAAAEEYLFRGWLVQTLGHYGLVPAVTAGAILFALAHGSGTRLGVRRAAGLGRHVRRADLAHRRAGGGDRRARGAQRRGLPADHGGR